MKKAKKYTVGGIVILLLAALAIIAAGVEAQQQKRSKMAPEDAKKAAADVGHAEALWPQIKDYRTWPVPQGHEGWQDGVSPHGKYLRYYINDAAKENPTKDGAILVKENYTEKNMDALHSITVMQKRKGYDPQTKDWFYVQYTPDGKVMTGPDGSKVAGLVGKGQEEGCVPCHQTAGGDDYLFMND